VSVSGCIKIVPKDSSSSGSTATTDSEPSGDVDWVLNDGDDLTPEPTATTKSSGTGNAGFDVPGASTPDTEKSLPIETRPVCDLKIQPESINDAPGIYTFTASTSTYSNAEFIWDIDGTVQQYGPQKTFTANLGYPGSGTVSVTLVVNGMEKCSAASTVTITQSQPVQCDLQISPATLSNVMGTYTFTANTSYNNAIFIWDINGSAYQPTKSNTFSVNFNAPGKGTVSVTMLVNGVTVCTATSYVTISNVIIVK